MKQESIIVYKDLPWYYAELLSWRVENGFVKVFPKKPLSDKAHREVSKVFKRWGGKFVSHNGSRYFEAPVAGVSSKSTRVAVDIARAYAELQKET